MSTEEFTKEELLRKAIQCYFKADMLDDACRCLELLDNEQTTPLYEQHQSWQQAAEAYQRTERWHKAAHCYLRCEQPVKAGECFLNAEDHFQAAWTFAEHAHLFYRALNLVHSLPMVSELDELIRDVIIARCDVGRRRREEEAGMSLYRMVRRFFELELNPRCHQLEAWAVTVASLMDRPDLIASTYAAAYHVGVPEAEKRWEAWALKRLGDATGVPLTPRNANRPAGLELFDFEVEVVTVNQDGNLIRRSHHQAEQYIEFVNGVAIEMVYVPGGTFLMGSPETEIGRNRSEGPQHQVTVAPFFLGRYPITQAQWQAVMGRNPSRFRGENRPVERVSWNYAVAFCKKLSELTGKNYHLPSEAQWEYACRAGTITPFYFGETITPELANYRGEHTYGFALRGIYRQETTDVGLFPPNAFGLYDMHGNVWEWCADNWHDDYNGAPTDGSVWQEGEEGGDRLFRGGSFYLNPGFCRAANRRRYSSGDRNVWIGVRVAAVAWF
jgi:formylglycine-generating enzyme required for sulfatase activity